MNKMDQTKIAHLHKAHLDNTLDPVEREEWEALLNSEMGEQPIKVLMDQTWHTILPEERIVLTDAESAKLYESIVYPASAKRVSLWPRIAVAAAAVASITLGVWLYRASVIQKLFPDSAASRYANDIAPGTNRATLTLANGKTIALSDDKSGVIVAQGLVRYQSNTGAGVVHPLAGVESLSVQTPRGGMYQVVLADGTHVWLNAASSLKFPSKFSGAERHVEITGEAYFEVAKDPKRKFIVGSAGQLVTVLGTHFNINSYQDEPVVKTTLMEGSVMVSAENRIQTIKPGEQVVKNGAELKVLKVNTALVTDWKDGAFSLDEVDFRVAMREIARWYDIEIIYDDTVPQDIQAWGWISKNSKLSAVLKLIENSGQVKFRLEGKKLYVFK